jgi:hypothetical protein
MKVLKMNSGIRRPRVLGIEGKPYVNFGIKRDPQREKGSLYMMLVTVHAFDTH